MWYIIIVVLGFAVFYCLNLKISQDNATMSLLEAKTFISRCEREIDYVCWSALENLDCDQPNFYIEHRRVLRENGERRKLLRERINLESLSQGATLREPLYQGSTLRRMKAYFSDEEWRFLKNLADENDK